ncbi:T-cell immunomodulatory protein [Nymphon striatum]|nr:T-cell immunomodulatory protein [Nymphon striatum]
MAVPGSKAWTIPVVPGDFNGDTFLDVLIAIKKKTSSEESVKIRILLGYKDKLDCGKEDEFTSMKGQPLALDYNGDGIIDLFGEDDKGLRSLWQIKNNSFVRTDFLQLKSAQAIKYPNSNAFVDLNGDLQADIFVTTEKTFEVWMNNNGKYTLDKTINQPDVSHLYQVGFCDLDANGVLDIIVPVCKSISCDDSAIYTYYNEKWEVIGSEFYYDGHLWKFIVPEVEIMKDMQQPTLRIADLNMDGFPDIMAVMHSNVDKVMKSKIFIMMNTATDSNPIGRKFNISYSVDIQNASTAAFHDLSENFCLENADMIALIILLGHICPASREFTLSSPSSRSHPIWLNLSGALFPQSAYFALHVPYMIFGLGQTPNFVESLKIGLPKGNDSREDRKEKQQDAHRFHFNAMRTKVKLPLNRRTFIDNMKRSTGLYGPDQMPFYNQQKLKIFFSEV